MTTRNKRKHAASSLREALELVETQKPFSSLQRAAEVWAQIAEFPPAKVLLASRKIAAKFFSEDPSHAAEKMIEENLDLFRELEEFREYRCCRGPAVGQHMPSSEIIPVVKPLMSAPKSKKLSAYSDLIEVMLKFTHVDVPGGSLEEWDEVEEWMNVTVEGFPLLSEILDPVFMFIRGHQGATPPGWIATQLAAIPVGRAIGGLSQAATAANTDVRRVAAEPAILNLYQFASLADANVARACLQTHANALALAAGNPVAGAQLQMLRLSVRANGMTWIV